MAHLTASVEYGLHCLLWLVGARDAPLSSRDLADLQGVSPTFLAKIFPRLERAGIVRASEGVRGGYQLARPADAISLLQVIDAIEGEKPLFDCQNVRGRCALFADAPPAWATKGVCAIHAVMLRAEQAMRAELEATSLADVAGVFAVRAPAQFEGEVAAWIDARVGARGRRGVRAPEEPDKESKPGSDDG